MRLLARLAASLMAAVATAVVVAIVAALVGMYLSGHGYPTGTQEIIDWPAAGIHLSAADIVLLVASIAAAVIAWRRTAPGPT